MSKENILKQSKEVSTLMQLWKILYEELHNDFTIDVIHDAIIIRVKRDNL